MPDLTVGPVHHVRLTVTDPQRSRAFYTELLGFDVAMDAPPPEGDPDHALLADALQGGVVLASGDVILGLRPVDPGRGTDRFDPFRVGLDHLSFRVGSTAELEAAAQRFDEHGVDRGEITSLSAFGIAVLSFRDPDGIQLELSAPLS